MNHEKCEPLFFRIFTILRSDFIPVHKQEIKGRWEEEKIPNSKRDKLNAKSLFHHENSEAQFNLACSINKQTHSHTYAQSFTAHFFSLFTSRINNFTKIPFSIDFVQEKKVWIYFFVPAHSLKTFVNQLFHRQRLFSKRWNVCPNENREKKKPAICDANRYGEYFTMTTQSGQHTTANTIRYSKNCLRETSNYGDLWWITTALTAFLFILCAMAFDSVGINTLTLSYYIRKLTQIRIKMNLMVEYAVATLFEVTFWVGFH